MVDAGVKVELAFDIAAFVGAAGNTDDACAGALGELTGDSANRPRSGRYDNGLAALRPADLAEPDIGGEPRHAQYAERRRQRRLVGIELEEVLCRHRAIELPPIAAVNIIALAKAGIARAHDLPDDPTLHDGADFDRLRVGAHPADAAAHIRIEREIDAAHQYLAIARIRHRPVGNLEISGRRRAGRAPFQQHLSVPVFHALFSLLRGDLELTDRLAHSKRHRHDRTERTHVMEPALSNPARERLEAGELALGVGIRQSRTVDIASIMKACGYDWLFLDLEHNSMDLDIAVQISVAALGAGIAPIVRVPAGQFWLAIRVLDGGALGIVMPHVDTPEEAREIADRLRYPPQGHRSMAGGLPHFGYIPIAAGAACAAINAATLVVVMLETPQAIANAPAIAAVPGIDFLLIGTSDLSMELGIPGQFGDERIVDAYRTVVEACNAHRKFAGIGGVYEESLMRRYIGMGVRLVLGGGDLGFMTAAATERAKLLRDCR